MSLVGKILICGANGQVGRELVQHAGSNATVCTREQLDITDAAAVSRMLDEQRPQVVINAAAYTAVDKAESEPERARAVNAEGAENLAAACHRVGAALLHLSTDYVFDGRKTTPYTESDIANPQGAYARSKWEGEERIRALCPRHIILRVSWVFGQHGGNFVKTMLRLARERPELRVVSDQHGAPTHAGAIAEALLMLAQRIQPGAELPWGTCHYSGTPATTWHGFATTIVADALELGLLTKAVPVNAISTDDYPVPAPRPANSRFDLSRAELLELRPQPWRDGLQQVLLSLKSA